MNNPVVSYRVKLKKAKENTPSAIASTPFKKGEF